MPEAGHFAEPIFTAYSPRLSAETLPSNLIEAISSGVANTVLQQRTGPLSNQSTPNTQLARLCEKTSIPYPGCFVGLTEVIGALQTGLYALSALSALMTISLRDPASDHKPSLTKAKRKTRICAPRLDRGACTTRAE